MQQGLQNPTLEVGVVTGKFLHDEEWYDECVRNANNAAIAVYCYPGGNLPINHDVLPGWTLIGKRNVAMPESDMFEIGLSSAAGVMWDSWCSQRAMEADHYWLGISNGEARKTAPLDSTTNDPPGVGTHRAGTKSIVNNSWKTVYAGDRLVWRFPAAPFHPKAGGDDPSKGFNGGDPINRLARQGDPLTQFRWEYEAYDATDFAVQMAAAFAALDLPVSEGGIKDMPYQNALPWAAGGPGVTDRPWSSIQEEALAYRYGFWGIALTLLETMKEHRVDINQNSAEIAEQIGLFDPQGAPTDASRPELKDCVVHGIADLLLDKISPCDAHRTNAEQRFSDNWGPLRDARQFAANPADLPKNGPDFYANLRAHCVDMVAIGLTSALEAKRSQIVGVAMNSAAPSDTLHVMFGHFAT